MVLNKFWLPEIHVVHSLEDLASRHVTYFEALVSNPVRWRVVSNFNTVRISDLRLESKAKQKIGK